MAARHDNPACRWVATAALALAAFSASAASGFESGAIIEKGDTSQTEQRVSAHEARRAGYRYLAALGYGRASGIGSARVSSVSREGDTWILRVAYATGSRVQSRTGLLYVDALSALVTQTPPLRIDGQVAAK